MEATDRTDDGAGDVTAGSRPRRWRLSARSFLGVGTALAVGGLLFVAKAVLDAQVGYPPTAEGALVTWRDQHHLTLALVDELFVIGSALVVLGAVGLAFALATSARPFTALTGCTLLALAGVVGVGLAAVHGRLVYPVLGLDAADPASVRLVVTITAGGMHVVALLLAAAAATLAVAQVGTAFGRAVVGVGAAAAVAALAVAYPDLVGVGGLVFAEAVVGGWIALTGFVLVARRTTFAAAGA